MGILQYLQPTPEEAVEGVTLSCGPVTRQPHRCHVGRSDGSIYIAPEEISYQAADVWEEATGAHAYIELRRKHHLHGLAAFQNIGKGRRRGVDSCHLLYAVSQLQRRLAPVPKGTR